MRPVSVLIRALSCGAQSGLLSWKQFGCDFGAQRAFNHENLIGNFRERAPSGLFERSEWSSSWVGDWTISLKNGLGRQRGSLGLYRTFCSSSIEIFWADDFEPYSPIERLRKSADSKFKKRCLAQMWSSKCWESFKLELLTWKVKIESFSFVLFR